MTVHLILYLLFTTLWVPLISYLIIRVIRSDK